MKKGDGKGLSRLGNKGTTVSNETNDGFFDKTTDFVIIFGPASITFVRRANVTVYSYGASYVMEYPENADKKPPWGVLRPLEALYVLVREKLKPFKRREWKAMNLTKR